MHEPVRLNRRTRPSGCISTRARPPSSGYVARSARSGGASRARRFAVPWEWRSPRSVSTKKRRGVLVPVRHLRVRHLRVLLAAADVPIVAAGARSDRARTQSGPNRAPRWSVIAAAARIDRGRLRKDLPRGSPRSVVATDARNAHSCARRARPESASPVARQVLQLAERPLVPGHSRRPTRGFTHQACRSTTAPR